MVFLKDEPEIVKKLRLEEKLGKLQSKIHNCYEELEKNEVSLGYKPEEEVSIIKLDDERKTSEDDISNGITEEKLKESFERYKMIFENVNDEIIYLDKHGKILDVNKRIKDICNKEWGIVPQEKESGS